MFLPRMKIALVLMVGARTTGAFLALGCADGEFSCDDGRTCVRRPWLCDGSSDCDDGTDEMVQNCAVHPSRNCSSSEHRCDSGKCIPAGWRCDGDEDCDDASDEVACASVCPASKFQCSDSSCIAALWRCDGERDCGDGSDEVGCDVGDDPTDPAGLPRTAHNVEYFYCDGGTRYPRAYLCDGDADCVDGVDEQNCTVAVGQHVSACIDEEFECSPSYCILKSWVCDGNADCENARDEANCPGKNCSEDEFRCASGECVLTQQRCNGAVDCVDATDEEGCDAVPLDTSSPPCSEPGHFHCDTGLCIPRSQLCDRIDNCGNNQDETDVSCVWDACVVDNGGCEQVCHNHRDNHTGVVCSCGPGYTLHGKYSCEDIDECKEAGACSQQCVNIAGSFHCGCGAGYGRDASDATRCKAELGDVALLFSHGAEVRSLRVRDRSVGPLVRGATAALAVDYHFERRRLVWSDIKERKVYRSTSLPEAADLSTAPEVIATGAAVADLAVDWLHDNIYFCDSQARSISLMDWQGRHHVTVVTDKVSDPRSIAVAPMEGRVYWSDWARTAPRIERAGLDGSHRSVLVASPHVVWPNGLTLDAASDRLYWVDAKLHSLASARRDGSDVTVVLYSRNLLHIPYSVAVFEDSVYWVDWVTKALYSADKFNGAKVTNLASIVTPSMVKVYHPYRQPVGNNVCSLRPCSHVCVRSVYGEATCLCPGGQHLMGRKCVETLVVTPEPTREAETRSENIEKFEKYIDDGMEDSDKYDRDRTNAASELIMADIEANVARAKVESSIDWKLLLGLTLGLCVASCVGGAVYVAYTRRFQSVTPGMMRFSNPVYRKTTNEERDQHGNGGGFTIAQEELFYQPGLQLHRSVQIEADEAPLTPDEGDF